MNTILLGSIVYQVVGFAREVRNYAAQKSAVATQALAWIVGIALTWVASHSGVASNVTIPGFDQSLAHLDLGSTVLIGMALSSLGSTGADLISAIDGTDSSAAPKLIPPAAAPAPGPSVATTPSPIDPKTA